MNSPVDRRRRSLPSPLAHRSFTLEEARALGLDWNALRARGAVCASRGVWIPEHLADPLFQARALSLHHPEGAISHLSAARIWGMPVPFSLSGDTAVHLTLPVSAASTRRRGVICHRLPFDPELDVVTLAAGTRVTTRLRTAADLAAVLELDDLVAVLDHLLRRPRPRLEKRPHGYEREPYATPDDLRDLVTQSHGRRGAKRLRHAVALARIGSDSPRETQLRLACVRAGLPEPELNVPIVVVDDAGRVLYELHSPDLQWKEFRVAAEYEGLHHSDPRQVERDVHRADANRDADYTEVRVVSNDMGPRCLRAVAKIEKALRANGWRPSEDPRPR